MFRIRNFFCNNEDVVQKMQNVSKLENLRNCAIFVISGSGFFFDGPAGWLEKLAGKVPCCPDLWHAGGSRGGGESQPPPSEPWGWKNPEKTTLFPYPSSTKFQNCKAPIEDCVF